MGHPHAVTIKGHLTVTPANQVLVADRCLEAIGASHDFDPACRAIRPVSDHIGETIFANPKGVERIERAHMQEVAGAQFLQIELGMFTCAVLLQPGQPVNSSAHGARNWSGGAISANGNSVSTWNGVRRGADARERFRSSASFRSLLVILILILIASRGGRCSVTAGKAARKMRR